MKSVLGLLCCLVLCVSCSTDNLNDSDFEAGVTFTDSNIRVLQLDTLTIKLSTMKFDSIVTSQGSRMLIGEYSDPIFGHVKSSSFVEMLPSSYTIDTDAEYDSIVFILRYDNYYYNDTLAQNTIHIKELNEKLSPEDDSDFYNSSSIGFDEEDLGTLTYTPRPLGTDSLQVRLSDAFGLDLFENLQDKKLTNYDEFVNRFNGLTLRPDEHDNGTVLGFSLASDMRLYYSIDGETESVQYYTDFTINTSTSPIPFFNQIAADGGSAYLQGFTDNEVILESGDADNQSFIQSGIGITTRIEFPYLKSVKDIQGEGTLLDATLRIRPKEASYNDNLILKDTLAVYLVDQNNDLSEQTSMQAILNRDNQEFNDIYYEIPISSYLEGLLETDMDNTDALILLPYNYNSTVDRFVLDVDSDNEGTQLELIYAIYDENE
ncbi:DUF4270 family protein [Maribacter polysiphoniae]|uniref:DUF4270 family protein n=1 Tax=Maribacter polysiphoniae TaxID=429344 RepID=A0A316E1U0_9FLAO|nr:DUF4270 family protein [Maribacter polysiphoniae]MBD1259043.1 DUF4270 family protein [Maribacter polysiphoniae]PWK24597.1 uncharacterized protein DUF4270 [Maribacter polysiphoniae]